MYFANHRLYKHFDIRLISPQISSDINNVRFSFSSEAYLKHGGVVLQKCPPESLCTSDWNTQSVFETRFYNLVRYLELRLVLRLALYSKIYSMQDCSCDAIATYISKAQITLA